MYIGIPYLYYVYINYLCSSLRDLFSDFLTVFIQDNMRMHQIEMYILKKQHHFKLHVFFVLN